MNPKFRNIVVISAFLAALAGLVLISTFNYLLFHSLVEGFSIVIAFGIFFVAYNSRTFAENNYLLFLGIAYPFIGSLDFLHMLAYQGMGVFEGYGANLPTQLWIQARYLEAGTLLLAPVFFRRRIRARVTFAIYILVAALLLASVFVLKVFPDCFVQPQGLTPFKTISEYIICVILLAALFLVVSRRERIDRSMLRYLTASIIATIASELAFTFYVSVYGLSNMLGHLFKILSFFFIYKGIIEACLRNPYSNLFLELKKNEEELREKEEELRDRNEDLQAFVHTAAHDLRTPLTSISGYAHLLDRSWQRGDPEKLKEMIDNIRNGVSHISKLLTDLLDFAFVGRKAALPVPVKLPDLMNKIGEEKREQVRSTKTRIAVSEKLPTLYMPETEAYQLFLNLFSNSLKFTRPGVPPLIEIAAGDAEPEGFGVITFTDNGAGIKEDLLERIFDLFVTFPGEQGEGTGAGLAIVKKIVEHNGGTIRVRSTPGFGTTFTLTLPIVREPGTGP